MTGTRAKPAGPAKTAPAAPAKVRPWPNLPARISPSSGPNLKACPGNSPAPHDEANPTHEHEVLVRRHGVQARFGHGRAGIQARKACCSVLRHGRRPRARSISIWPAPGSTVAAGDVATHLHTRRVAQLGHHVPDRSGRSHSINVGRGTAPSASRGSEVRDLLQRGSHLRRRRAREAITESFRSGQEQVVPRTGCHNGGPRPDVAAGSANGDPLVFSAHFQPRPSVS